jgi:hypothetical protein
MNRQAERYFSVDCYPLGSVPSPSDIYEPSLVNGSLPAKLSTTWRTSGRHHLPLGFLVVHGHDPIFFAAFIFSIIIERPCLMKSCRMSSLVYLKQ